MDELTGCAAESFCILRIAKLSETVQLQNGRSIHHRGEHQWQSTLYLQIDGIKGESTDSKHQGWIECESVHWSVNQPRSATASTAGGHTAERVELSEVTFTKLSDLSSPILLQTCAVGKTIPNAKFEFFRADGSGERVKYYEVELDNVLVAHVAPGVSSGAMMQESVHLKSSKVKSKYSQQKISGGAGGNTAGGWDLATNKVA